MTLNFTKDDPGSILGDAIAQMDEWSLQELIELHRYLTQFNDGKMKEARDHLEDVILAQIKLIQPSQPQDPETNG